MSNFNKENILKLIVEQVLNKNINKFQKFCDYKNVCHHDGHMANWVFRVTKELNYNEIEVFKKIIKEIMYKICINILDNFIIINKIFDFNNNLENNSFENYKNNLANELFKNYKDNDIFKNFNEAQLEKLIFLIKVFVIIITNDLCNIFKNSNLKLFYYKNNKTKNNYEIYINYIKNELIKQLD